MYSNLHFVTGNAGKFAQAKLILPDLLQLDAELPEIQELELEKVLEVKLDAALQLKPEGNIVVEDSGLFFEGLPNLPGVFTKWFLKSLGANGMQKLAEQIGNTQAYNKICLGYVDKNLKKHFISAQTNGKIVPATGENGFGWDAIFMPEGYDKTYAQFTPEEKNEVSPRAAVFKKLRDELL